MDEEIKILCIDTDPKILKSLTRLFHEDPFSILTASTAAEGIELLSRDTVSVILSDNMLPGMTGIELLELAKSISPDSIRILMTGLADPDVAIAAINKGEIFKFIMKPWDNDEIRRIVCDSIAKYKIVLAIRNADDASILSLAQTIELKDPYTKGHCERVAVFALMIADALNLNREKKKHIKYGSWLHDCGKIGVPELILNTPGPLDDEQFATVKRHARWGGDVVNTSRIPETVVNIAVYHHERFDGTGYPLGLSSTHIPVEARIVAIADAYDAMTSDRPYRKRLSHVAAIDALRKGKNATFDPTLVDIFVNIIDTAG
jgi:response regulator RpfG family c-di-GMP phosphodiesterase